MDDIEKITDEFWKSAEAILPGRSIGFINIVNGVTSSSIIASYEENENGNYDIFIVYDPEEDYTIEPECQLFETVNKKDFKNWLKNYGLQEDYKD